MQSTYRIPSKLYFDLYQKGGDKLIAVYSVLKQSRNEEKQYFSFTSKNNKKVSGYSLLRNKTNLSLHTLKKYVPILIDARLCSFNDNGDFLLLGNRKAKKLYNSYKLVPINIGKNLIHTSYNSFLVRLHSNEKKQCKKIQKNNFQSELLIKQNNPSTLKELKEIKKLLREDKKGFETDVTVLSIKSYANLKDLSSDKSKGYYWKKKLIDKNVIKSKRRFLKIKKMTFDEFSFLKNNCKINKEATYHDGCLSIELVSEFKTMSV